MISKYNLLAVPVVDEGGHVLGIVTVDDVIDAIVRGADGGRAEVRRYGGARRAVHGDRFLPMIKKRARLAVRALSVGDADGDGDAALRGRDRAAVVLAMFIPLVMSSGGNSGSQATSLIIRAMALREIRLRDWWRIAVRELPTGLTLGAILGVIGVVRISLWQQLRLFDYGPHHRARRAHRRRWRSSASSRFGSLAGSMLPFILRRLGFDPASASAPFVATLVDVTGLVIYFSVALVVLRGTLL